MIVFYIREKIMIIGRYIENISSYIDTLLLRNYNACFFWLSQCGLQVLNLDNKI